MKRGYWHGDGLTGLPNRGIKTDTADIIDDICPKGASVPEVNWLKEQLEKLHKGTAL